MASWPNGKTKQTLFMSQLKPGMGCTLDGAAPDNKAVERGRSGAREEEEQKDGIEGSTGRRGPRGQGTRDGVPPRGTEGHARKDRK